MKKSNYLLLLLFTLLALFLTACGKSVSEEKKAAPSVQTAESSVTPEQLKSLMDEEQDMILLDVRSFNDYGMGHIPNAVNIPLNSLSMLAKEQLPDQEAAIYVYCSTSDCTNEAVALLTEAGYTNVYSAGSYQDWPYDTTAPISC
jgi:phage shock protein E